MQTTVLTRQEKSKLWFVIAASSVGTLIEWYDFYIFGSLAIILSEQFFPQGDPTASAPFDIGNIRRGLCRSALWSNCIRKAWRFGRAEVYLHGHANFNGWINVCDWSYTRFQHHRLLGSGVGVSLRLLQGLALGGEYGGAATYVAEHAPAAKRGFYTSFIQTTATLGLFVSIGVILGVRQNMGIAEFNEWGWRIPFLLSAFLVAVSVFIRLRMQESPLFAKIKSEGKISKNPIKESFGKKENLKLVLLALFGATAGQGVVWYTGQFYAMTFIESTCKVEFVQTRNIIAIALLIGTPLFIYFGWLSDKIGRKMIMMVGMLAAVLLYRPIYKQMYGVADVSGQQEMVERNRIEKTTSMTEAGDSVLTVRNIKFYAQGNSVIEKNVETIPASGSTTQAKSETKKEVVLGNSSFWAMIGLVLIQLVLVTMVYGPIAAFLVELFPTRIRYTSMSLPYHIGNGIFGGLTPFIATLLYERSKSDALPMGDPFAGLWYPIIVAAICFIIGMIFLSNKKVAEVVD